MDSLYLDLEALEYLLKLSDPIRFLSAQGDKLVILDEIHWAPDLLIKTANRGATRKHILYGGDDEFPVGN